MARTREEILKEIENVEDCLFMLKMQDTWGAEGFERKRYLNKKLADLNEELEQAN